MARHSAHSARSAQSTLSLPRLVLGAFLILVACASALGLLLTWPSSDPVDTSEAFETNTSLTGELAKGTVFALQPGQCNSPAIGTVFSTAPPEDRFAPKDCTHALVDITSGDHAGQRTVLEVHPDLPGSPDLQQGDSILLTHSGQVSPEVAPTDAPLYAFQDFQRSSTMWWWLAATVALIVLIGAWRGARSIVGLALTLLMIVVYLIPSLTHGGSPVTVALVCGASVLFLVLFLVHGASWKTASALGGTLLALGIAVGLSALAVHSAGIRGLGDENNLNILLYLPGIDIQGLMLAGMIIGALGVLNDVTIAQSSTVTELHEANPHWSPWDLFQSAMRVGRDHIASMVYTLVLSYTGVALPMLLLLSTSSRPLEQILTSDVMATEILRSATGAIALVMAVPLATAIAALTVRAPQTKPKPQPQA
ncbi:YibE/F family protein [Corynebacterium sp. zg254]|uniref:YibE/F family protein n=1 Tax=Corynebacterium zhongnanshanii TaxID=2768834 RepID=A0ABQ6VI31_9CORY|nr:MULTISPECIES: YibE/F family protein [Corynebacterium]KAB3519901.1 YibE/F family protein [Corynebacterium zhongnanshanii]MCR5914847.1 YibE/F family protein [Corynebacterium sp. zg254]